MGLQNLSQYFLPLPTPLWLPGDCWRDGEGQHTGGPSSVYHSAGGFPGVKLPKKLG